MIDDLPSFPATVHLDAEGRIRAASAAAAAMLGYEPLALADRTLPDLAAEGWREAAAVASAKLRFGSDDDFTLMLRGRSGRRSLIEMSVLPPAGTQPRAGDYLLAWSSGRMRREASPAADGDRLQQLAYSLMQRREAERLDIAKRLHDELAPTLAMAKYLVEDAAQRGTQGLREEASELLGQACANLRQVVGELRNISNALRPRLLDDLGLLPTLEWYCRVFEEAHPGLAVLRTLSATERNVPGDLKVEIFRIVQEALANVARHSRATAVRLSLIDQDGEVRLSIEDNGVGFDAAAAFDNGAESVGLLSIRKRIRATGGLMALESGFRRGTQIGARWTVRPGHPSPEVGDGSYYPNRSDGASIRQ